MAGDMADDVLPDGPVIELLDGIAGGYPCYYVTGNHEFWSDRVETKKEIFRAPRIGSYQLATRIMANRVAESVL